MSSEQQKQDAKYNGLAFNQAAAHWLRQRVLERAARAESWFEHKFMLNLLSFIERQADLDRYFPDCRPA